jgi:hypothetical protein
LARASFYSTGAFFATPNDISDMLMIFPIPYRGSPASFFKTIKHHEAGHEVVAVRFGIPFSYVTVAADGTSHIKMWRRHTAKGIIHKRAELGVNTWAVNDARKKSTGNRFPVGPV